METNTNRVLERPIRSCRIKEVAKTSRANCLGLRPIGPTGQIFGTERPKSLVQTGQELEERPNVGVASSGMWSTVMMSEGVIMYVHGEVQ